MKAANGSASTTSGTAEGREPLPPRILWVTERYPPTPGGMATSCARQVRGLRLRGWSLDVFALGPVRDRLEIEVRSREGGSDLLLPRAVSRGLVSQKIWQLVRERHARRPYTHAVGFGANFPGYLAVTLAAWLEIGALALVRGNDLDRDWFDPRRAHMVRECLARAQVVGAVSTDKLRQIRALFPEQDVRWLPNGIDGMRWRLLARDEARRDALRAELAVDGRRVVGIFGEIKPKKRVPFWLGALRDRGLVERLSFLVVGRVDEETEELLADPALTPHVHREPFLDPDALPGYYAACDYLALPSMFEGLPNVLLEAMACGVVPVCTRVGGMPDVLTDGETGFLFDPEDREAAGDAMERALDLDEAALGSMGQRVRDHVSEAFSETRELDGLEELMGLRGGDSRAGGCS